MASFLLPALYEFHDKQMSSGNQVMGPGPLDPHGNSIINESMWDAVFPLLDAHFLQVRLIFCSGTVRATV